jgi:hypothetical protein
MALEAVGGVVPQAFTTDLVVTSGLRGRVSNRRASRLLTLQLLYKMSFEVGRYISLERVGELNRGPGGKAAQARQAIDKMTKPFSLSELQAECPGVSLPTIKRELGAMKDEGLVMLTGRGRGAKWKRLG